MNIVNELERLAELHRAHAISDEEFASAKALLLNPSATRLSTGDVDSRHALPANLLAPTPSPPEWMKACGWLVTLIGLVGFLAVGYASQKQGDRAAGLVAGLLNPLFFVGTPLGVYWLSRSGELQRLPETEAGKFLIAASIVLGVPFTLWLVGVFQ